MIMNMNLTLNLTLNEKLIINESNFVMFKGGSHDSDLLVLVRVSLVNTTMSCQLLFFTKNVNIYYIYICIT